MSRAKLARRIIVSVVAALLVVILVGVVVVVGLVRHSFPQTTGTISVPGLGSRVSVLRDEHGVPQIYADSSADLFEAQGYVTAQDRFFEMDLRRHITAGRLSELVGSAGLDTDKVIRTMGWRRVAEQELPTLAPSTRQYLQAYADGVNAYINQMGSPSQMGFEYTVLSQKVDNYHVEPWTPVDSLAWLKAMAWDLRGNYDDELMRARLAGTSMSMAHIAELYPDYPFGSHKPILSSQDWSPSGSGSGSDTPGSGNTTSGSGSDSTGTTSAADASSTGSDGASSSASPYPAYLGGKTAQAAYAQVTAALDAVPTTLGRGDGIGSNSWVVGSSRSSTGKPLLANDPHLAPGIPGIWYQTGLHCRSVGKDCPFDVAGYSFSGLPGVVIGHNQTISWGFTNLGPDVSDFYLEQVNGDKVLRDGSYVPLTTRRETIKVAGGNDVSIDVRSTRHGPLMSDVLPSVADAGRGAPVDGKKDPGSYDVSLAWTGLQPGHTADALFAIDKAQSFEQFRGAAKNFDVPAQNLVYADANGHIGYQAPGRIPERRSAIKGSPPGFWPAPGWDSRYDWTGYVPFKDMPTSYDPPEDYIVAANQAVTASDRPFLTTEWDYGFRSQRIRDLLAATPKVTPARMSQIQGDTRNTFAPDLVKYLLPLKVDPFTADAQRLLKGWNYTTPTGQSRNGAAAAYYNAVWSNILELTFDDELPKDLKADGGGHWMQVVEVMLEKPRDSWWDNKGTAGVLEGRDEILRQAMVQARLELTKQLGKDPVTWQWGRLHRLDLQHPVLGTDAVPGYVRVLFNRGPWDMPGGSSIVDANGWDAGKGYQVDWAPSMRMVVDLGHLDGSHWVNQTGASGHPFNDHYDDQTDAWATNQTFPWPVTESAVRKATKDELTLVPGADKG
ncbi:MAG: penicillin acylase family protein [Oryzihumus sp.]